MLDAPAIVKTLGGDWYGSYGLAPGPGHSKRDRSLKIWIGREGEPRFHSFAGDDWRSVKDELRAQGLLQEWNSPWTPKFTHRDAASTQRVPETRKRWSAYAEDMWRSCTRLSGIALEYLHARGCAIPHKDGDLRWHPSLENKRCRWTGPALVARVTDALSKDLHRTWIAATGKVKIKVSKLPLKGHVKAGGVIRPARADAKTCGPRCRQKAYRRRVTDNNHLGSAMINKQNGSGLCFAETTP